MAYRTIRTGAWQAVNPDASIRAGYRALPFPEHWRAAVLNLCDAGRPKDSEPYRTVPTRRLEGVFQTLLPDLLVLPRSGDDPARPWLLVPDGLPLPPDGPFRTLLNGWLKDLRPEPALRAALVDARRELAANPPTWEPVELELLRCGRTNGGTAEPLDHQYQLAADWVAGRILGLEPFEHQGITLRFRSVPRGASRFERGAELVSQPLEFPGKERSWWYSVVLAITVQTVPFHPLPRFHLHVSLRRWATVVRGSTKRLHIPHRSRTTVLLRPRIPWLPGALRSERFAVARLENDWSRESGGRVAWVDGGPAHMLEDLPLAEPFPDAELLVSDPEAWLTDMRAAVVFGTAMGSHGVKPGFMPHQRSQLTEWAEQALPPELRPVPALNHTALAATTPANRRVQPKPAEKEAEHERGGLRRRVGLAHALGSTTLETRLLWQTSEMRNTLIAGLARLLDLPADADLPTDEIFEQAEPGSPALVQWHTRELTVRLRCLKLTGGLAGDLVFAQQGRRTNALVAEAIKRRRTQTAEFLLADGAGPSPSLALVEIDRRADFSSGDHDPKFALRLGAADAGVLTQFVLVPKKIGREHDSVANAAHRAEMSWDDGLRQLGVRVHPKHTLAQGVPADLGYAAIWMVRKNRSRSNRWAQEQPVAVLVTPEGDGLARVQGWDAAAEDGAGAWVSYPEMLLRLARTVEPERALVSDEEEHQKPISRRDARRERTEEWLQTLLLTLRGRPTLLLAQAQNARQSWTWLQDGVVEQDRIKTGKAPARPLAPDLRLMRLRITEGRETPQWWGVHPKDGYNGIPSHLWVDPECPRVFWSTTPKAGTFKSTAVQADKLGHRRITQGQNLGKEVSDVDKQGWNPGLIELAVLGCHQSEGDAPEALAAAVHQMRQPPDYRDALRLPLPLHLAALAQEYVLPVAAEETGTDGEDDMSQGGELG
ncbi:DUF3893 domain-containing protein [Herbidospora galbida]|uniref:DUF3893 domain-containing protein n=1 Tax=Herbidospora galbida TaxID=2575442 RepID=A0A4U3MCD4_9ACTN|nr:DUF3962 domain-containing protein [Herbidospora galbida]TKK85377.1 DUF3893 domain-containing protein [Herbidospora galbida]